jgi:hypothetical protein
LLPIRDLFHPLVGSPGSSIGPSVGQVETKVLGVD